MSYSEIRMTVLQSSLSYKYHITRGESIMGLVAQCDSNGYYLQPTEDYDQGLPGGCFGTIPIKINADKKTGDPDGWYNGYWPRLNTSKTSWNYEPDYRGQTWYVGDQSITISTLGPLPDGATKEPVYTEEQKDVTIMQLKSDKFGEIKIARTNMLESGVWYKGFLFQTRQEDRNNLSNVYNLVSKQGWIFGTTYAWRSDSNVMVPFTLEDVENLYTIMVLQTRIIHEIGWKDRDVTLASMTKISDIQEFTPTKLTNLQIQAMIDERLNHFKPR